MGEAKRTARASGGTRGGSLQFPILRYKITPEEAKEGAPLIADLSFPDVAIIGFTDGSVRVLTRKDLGLESGDPIIVGASSKSELLKKLSDE